MSLKMWHLTGCVDFTWRKLRSDSPTLSFSACTAATQSMSGQRQSHDGFPPKSWIERGQTMTDTLDYAAVIAAQGAEFLGIQRTLRGDLILFTDPQYRS